VKLKACLALISVALLTGCDPPHRTRGKASAETAPVAAAGAPDYRFGITGVGDTREAPALLRELGVGWVRVPVNWGQVEPRRGDYNWAKVERAMAAQRRSMPQVRVMVTLRAKSPWAGGRGVREADREKASFPPTDLDAYYEFVHGMAQRGRGLVEVWQIENEEEGRNWWAGTPEQYLTLLRTAHRAIRSADPQAKIMLGGFTSEMTTAAAAHAAGRSQAEIARLMGHHGAVRPEAEAAIRRNVAFISTVLAGAGDLVDLVDIHLYNDYDTIPTRVSWLRNTMLASGYEKPIWATEVGGPDALVAPYSDEAAAQEVVKRMVLAFTSGVETAFWLGLLEGDAPHGERFNHLGLMTRNGRQKPAFVAYQTLTSTLGDLPYASTQPVPGGFGARFGEGGRTVEVMWSDHSASYRLAATGPVTAIDIRGRTETLQPRNGAVSLRLTASPILVRQAQP
jgi:hypothetical protein